MRSLFLLFLVFLPWQVEGGDFDCYVDRSVSEEGDGSQNRPFEKLSQALEECEGKIFLKNGTYSENVFLKKATKLYGENKQKTVISGRVTMSDETLLENLTVRGASTVISVEKDADVKIENCTIKDFGKIGIETLAGKGKLSVVDSKIINGQGKGLYIQRGKTIEILNNEIYENDEEGLDIRSKVSGVVEKNILRKNGESGIELVVGSSDLKIKGNLLEKNGASGVAVQFYSERDHRGKIYLVDNKIGENRKYGLDCNRPQGGSPGDSYWKDSLELETNNIYSNKLDAINSYCKLVDVVDEDEEKDNVISEEGYKESEEEAETETETVLTLQEEARIKNEEEERKSLKEEQLKELERLLDEQEKVDKELEVEIEELGKEKRWKIFFLGMDLVKIEKALVKLEQEKNLRQEMVALLESAGLDAEEELSIQGKIEALEKKMTEHSAALEEKRQSFSLWGWIKKRLKF